MTTKLLEQPKQNALDEAIAKKTELQHQLGEVKEAIANLRPTSSVQHEAEFLLIGQRADITDHREERQKLVRQREVIDEAIRLQERVVARERAADMARQRDANQAEHAKLLLAFKDRLLAAEAAAVAVERFYAEVENAVHRTMRFAPFGEFDPQNNRFENVARWEDEGNEFEVFKS